MMVGGDAEVVKRLSPISKRLRRAPTKVGEGWAPPAQAIS